MKTLDVRPSPIAGTWYESMPRLLASKVDGYLEGVNLPKIDGQVVGVIAPHAGHKYSGQVAAYAFAALRSTQPDLVVVLSPYHNAAPHPLIVTKHQAYATPLGSLEVDEEALAELQQELEVPITRMANDREHSLEIELPFLQRIYKHEFKLLPIMLRDQAEHTARALGEALGRTLKERNVVFVASTDLSHFYDQQTAGIFDRHMLQCFETFNPHAIFEAEYTGKGFACGHAAVAAALWACRHLDANRVQVLNYATSGDVTRDLSSVVGYGAAAILKE